MADAINIIISAKDGATGILNSVNNGMKNLNLSAKAYHSTLNALNGYVNEFNAGLQRMVGIFGGMRIAKDFIDTAASFEKTKLMLEGLMGSVQQADKAFDWIKDFSTKSPFSIGALSDSFVKLKAAGIDPTTGSMQILTDAVAAFGGSDDELKRVMIAISQMAGKGVVSMEELRQQLGEVLPTAIKVMAREMGLSIAQLTGMISTGSVDFETGQRALLAGLEKDYKGAGQRMMSGWAGIMAQMSGAWQALENTLMQSGVFDALKNVITNLTQQLKSQGFVDAAKQIGKAVGDAIRELSSLGKTAWFVLSALNPLKDIFVNFLPIIATVFVGWKTLSLSFRAFVGLPLSIYREIMALNSGFAAMTGMSVGTWLKNLIGPLKELSATYLSLPAAMDGVVAGLATLGLAFAAFWGASKIIELIKLFMDATKAEEEMQKVSKKYLESAKEFDQYKDLKIKSLQELKLMEEEQLQAEYNNLQKSLAYWSRYMEGIRIKLAATPDILVATEANFGPIESEVDALNEALSMAQKQMDLLMDSFGSIGQAARENGQALVDFRDNTIKVGEGKTALGALALSADDAERSIEQLSKEHERLAREASAAYDFAAERAKAMASDEKSAALTVLEEYRRKKDYLINLANETARTQMNILNQSKMKEKDYNDEVAKIAQQATAAKAKALENWIVALKSAHIKALTEAKKYEAEVKQIDKDIAANQVTTQEMLRELRRRGMTEEQAWNDRRKQAYEDLRKAMEMIATAQSPDELKEAVELAKKARSEFNGLAGEVKNGDQVVVSEAKSVREATNGVRAAGEAISDAMKKQKEMAQQRWKDELKAAEDYHTKVKEVEAEFEKLAQMKVSPKVEYEPDTSKVDAARDRISQPITVPVNYDPNPSGESGHRMGGQIPGWGGGDKIRAMLEPGEFVIRKESVAKYGSSFFHALNNMRINVARKMASLVPSIPAFATGGMVGASSDYGTLRLRAGDVELPVSVKGPNGRQMVREFAKQLEKMRLTGGR